MKLRKAMVLSLIVTFFAPIVLYTDSLGSSNIFSPSRNEFIEEVSAITFGGEIKPHNLPHQESSTTLKNNLLDTDASTGANSRKIRQLDQESMEHKTTVSTTSSGSGDGHQVDENPIRQAIEGVHEANQPDIISNKHESTSEKKREEEQGDKEILRASENTSNIATENLEIKPETQSAQMSTNVGMSEPTKTKTKYQTDQTLTTKSLVRHLKDQLIRGKVYLSLAAKKNNPQLIGELQLRMKETQRALGDAIRESKLPKNAHKKLKAMEQTLAKGKQIQDDHTEVVKKLRAMMHSAEEQLQAYKKQTVFLTHLTTKTLPKGLHCLPLRLAVEYFNLNSSERQFPNQEKLEDPWLYHYALFSDNLLAAAVVVNSTVSNAKDPSNHVFHIVTDRPNFAAMSMWFLVNPPGKATIQVQNIEELAWLNSSYSPVLSRLDSSSIMDYYLRTYSADSDSNSKFRNPKYLSSLNHLRFYLPEIFPNLNKILFLDDDIVVQKDLTPLWSLDMKGKVNGAVETCGGTFHRFNRYLNFSNPLISKNFDPLACAWAFGMNIFDLKEWKRQNVTEVYHTWQNLNQDRQLWKLGTLPPGLVTFWNRTYLLDHSWHVLGLGYKPNVSQKDIRQAAVIHYNGDLKPWLEIGISEYRSYWENFIDFNHLLMQECNINPLNEPK
ncbi:probable galacturonosyltransferase 4 [Cornus florida]|uniref:probable galacturonosyltransferase 4 n=1 Tax=Cornus florida TaxID=4283 RepID=UPI00289DF40E|nr:probable galacturonosyltransferase 4 [Cornus florida]